MHPSNRAYVPPSCFVAGFRGVEAPMGGHKSCGELWVPLPCVLSPAFSLKCIKDKKVPIGVTVHVFCSFPVKKFPSCPACPSPNHSSCLENGIGYREKCFYFVEDEAEWNRSETFCRSLGAHLATIDTWQELRFLLRYGGSLHYWIGLRREGSAPWTWFNGSLFNNSYVLSPAGDQSQGLGWGHKIPLENWAYPLH
uniref:C-type lectin domain-containing protein n=1 Tax=Strigops habroptila TaxID=2489341 RepID=A0A672U1S5_STRHB